MSENDIIAEYVKEKFQCLLDTTDYKLYRLGILLRVPIERACETLHDGIDWDAVWETLSKEPKELSDTWKQQTMSRFERVE